MEVFHDIESYKKWRRTLAGSVGFVPTMGALHAGHAKLLSTSAEQNRNTVLSIFVNPTQFGPNEDLSKYPRTLDSDLVIAQGSGVSAVFVPTPELLYPAHYSTYVNEEKVSEPLCGSFRPGHFRGVATIVLKLFNIIEPSEAYFGLKDAQQFFVIERMVQDLNVNVKIKGFPTVREASGLALSSRNVFLSAADRETRAPQIFSALEKARKQLLTGKLPTTVLKDSRSILSDTGFEVQYFELRGLPDFQDLSNLREPLPTSQKVLLAVAAFLPSTAGGNVRLIDNLIF